MKSHPFKSGWRAGSRTTCCRSTLPRNPLPLLLLIPVLAGAALSFPGAARGCDESGSASPPYRPSGVLITDGSYVMNVGDLHVNITNHGLIGSQFTQASSYADAPSAQWPSGSSDEYLWSAGLWVGAKSINTPLVSTGQFERELMPPDAVEYTIYEAIDGRVTRPFMSPTVDGLRNIDDDDDGMVDEDDLNGLDDDGDGLIDEDFGQVGKQMMTCIMTDDTRLSQELNPDHEPLHIEITQRTFAWANDLIDDAIGLDFTIRNTGIAPLEDVFIGFFADCDIGRRGEGGGISNNDMVGFFDSIVRVSDGSFAPVSAGYMYDAAKNDPLPGYIGILFLDHDVDPAGRAAPTSVGISSFQHFSATASFEEGGDPTNDIERYDLLSRREIDPDPLEGKENDYRFLISTGPFKTLEPGEALDFRAALVLGEGLEGLKKNCGEIARTWYGEGFNIDGMPATGVGGRETLVCAEDFETRDGKNPLLTMVADLMDTTCTGPVLDLIQEEDLTEMKFDGETKHCIWVNMDNCLECTRQAGRRCTAENGLIFSKWNCRRTDLPADQRVGCTGIMGKETMLRWLAEMPPEPPEMRVDPGHDTAEIFWTDASERSVNLRNGERDFESYRIWRADGWDRPFGSSETNGPASTLWQLIAEYDVINEYCEVRHLQAGTVVDTLPLGANTGLAGIRYRPCCLDDPRFAGLAAAMDGYVCGSEVTSLHLPVMRKADGVICEGMEVLAPWEDHPAVLDTFYMMTDRPEDASAGLPAKPALGFNHYVDRDVHNGFTTFYSVTANSHSYGTLRGVSYISGPGNSGDPSTSFLVTKPGTPAQTVDQRARHGVNIYVYPNPATREALAEFQQMHPNSDDPTGVRVNFANLPQARNTIKIFSLDGDLVQTLHHDGTASIGEASWNLVSRNGQQIASGIYLYVVHSDIGGFEDHIGKFVVVR